MTITREQVADLQPGDVVELSRPDVPGARASAPVVEVSPGRLYVGIFLVRWEDGEVPAASRRFDLTVVSRAPRPLYVNHPRTEPVHGDIVRDGDGDAWQNKGGRWHLSGGSSPTGVKDISDCSPLRLLWDGETGQVVP